MPLRKFELLSLVGRKKQQEEALPPPSSSHSSSRPPYTSGFNRAPSTLPPPPPAPALPTRDGFYSSVQYERLTPSVNGRPPVLGPSSTMGSARSSSFHSVSHAPPLPSTSPAQVQYERIGPSASSSVRLPSPQYERITPGSASPSTLLNHRSPVPSYRQSSPLQYDSGPRNASFPSPSTHSLPSPPVALHSPVDVPPLRSDALRRDRRGGGPPLAPVAENGSPNVAMGDSTPSDKSTPFSMVMEEWMSQLRTPTPDVMLLPSPYDFNKDTPTPVERMEDIKHINEALLPTPPPASAASLGVQDQMTQGTKSSDFVLSSANPNNNNRRPLVEDIASLCRDLITQEVSEQLAKRLMKMGAFATAADASAAVRKATGSFSNGGAFGRQPSSRKNDDNDDDDDQFDDTSSIGGSVAGGGKGKRRKMCTSEGCQNLSRSRGLCKAHGGGRRCSVDGCTRASQSGSLCITHGGGKRCTVDGCDKAAQSRGMCKAHGGGVRCRVDGCTKSSQGDGYCRTHGGGRRCGHESGCQKWAQRNGMCMAHSEGRYGNSYRGRVARRADDPNTSIGDAAQALVKASMSS